MLAVCHFHQRCIATSTSLLSNGSSIHQGSSSASSFVRSIASMTPHFWFCIHHQLVVWADFSPDQPGRRRPPVGLPPAGERKPSSHHRGDLQYIRDFDRLVQTTTTARDLYDQMLQLHPLRMNVKHDSIRTSDLFAFMFCLPGRTLETKLPKRVASDRMAMAAGHRRVVARKSEPARTQLARSKMDVGKWQRAMAAPRMRTPPRFERDTRSPKLEPVTWPNAESARSLLFR
jgi:hypothetical protein